MSDDSPAKGLFIVLEGIDGAGTTTQCGRLAQWLRDRGEKVHATRQPSDGPIGTMIRQILTGRLQARQMNGTVTPIDPATIALLFAADRIDHLQNEIEPYTRAGYHVICDRYVLSSLAYQAVDVGTDFVQQINALAAAPDLTVFLEVAPHVGMQRIADTRAGRDAFETLEFQKRVATAYAQAVETYSAGRVETIDGLAPLEDVFDQLRDLVRALLVD